jgi:hypothetical protein
VRQPIVLAMARERLFAHQLIFIISAAFMMMVAPAGLRAENEIFSPDMLGNGSSRSDQAPSAEKSASPPRQANESTKWMSLPQVPFINFYRDDLKAGVAGDTFDSRRAPASVSESGKSNKSSWLGNGQLEIRTQKKFQPFWLESCGLDDDDCADNSGLPKTGPAKRTLKNLRKPFFGLSITTPLQ